MNDRKRTNLSWEWIAGQLFGGFAVKAAVIAGALILASEVFDALAAVFDKIGTAL